MGFRKGNFVEDGISYPCYIQIFGSNEEWFAFFDDKWDIHFIDTSRLSSYMFEDVDVYRADPLSHFCGSFLRVSSPEAFMSLTQLPITSVQKELIVTKQFIDNLVRSSYLQKGLSLFVPDDVYDEVILGQEIDYSLNSVFNRSLVSKLKEQNSWSVKPKDFCKRLKDFIPNDKYQKYLADSSSRSIVKGSPFWFKDTSTWNNYDGFSYLAFYDTDTAKGFTIGKDGCRYYLNGISYKYIEDTKIYLKSKEDGKKYLVSRCTSKNSAKYILDSGIYIADIHPNLLLSPEKVVKLDVDYIEDFCYPANHLYRNTFKLDNGPLWGLLKGTPNTYIYHKGDDVVAGIVEVPEDSVTNTKYGDKHLTFSGKDVFVEGSHLYYLKGNIQWKGEKYADTFYLNRDKD